MGQSPSVDRLMLMSVELVVTHARSGGLRVLSKTSEALSNSLRPTRGLEGSDSSSSLGLFRILMSLRIRILSPWSENVLESSVLLDMPGKRLAE